MYSLNIIAFVWRLLGIMVLIKKSVCEVADWLGRGSKVAVVSDTENKNNWHTVFVLIYKSA